MALAPGTRLGVYDITAQIGEGGMGQVYRARDTKLNRDVALKILPDAFASDPERLARFTREAQTLASLNHPNIAQIYGLEESNGVRALVMELVEGDDLSQRIARGAIPIDEALPMATQIAAALEAAHGAGVIHRDLKPANIKVRPDGTVKVLDFGLAKAMDNVGRALLSGPAGSKEQDPAYTQSPTITTPAMTQAGMILGTAAYMSPEQAKGRAADKRCDIWAFGAVLYEMLTGTRAFEGEDVSDTLAAVLRAEPEWSRLPGDVPLPVRTLLESCLVKDARRRIADISTALFVLDKAASLTPDTAPVPITVAAQVRPLWRRAALPVAALLIGAAGASGIIFSFLVPQPTPDPVTRFAMAAPADAPVAYDVGMRALAISPDGSKVAYTSANVSQYIAGAPVRLFVRALDQLQPIAMAGPGDVREPFFSPDGAWIGFLDPPNRLHKVPVTGGPPTLVATLDGTARGATWGTDGTIIFATNNTATGLQRISANGGPPEILTHPNQEKGERDHLYPHLLPGGRAVLFTIAPTNMSIDDFQIAVLDLRDRSQKIVLRGGSDARYASGGYLVFGNEGTLRAVAFDADRLEVRGTSVTVAQQVATGRSGSGWVNFDVAANGTLTYMTGAETRRTLVWVDRKGEEEPINVPPRVYTYARLSPDGTRVALDSRDEQNDIWIWDLARQTLQRLTNDPGMNRLPAWTPDGKRVAFSAEREGVESVYWQAFDGSGTIERLSMGTQNETPSAFSPDGTRVIVVRPLSQPYDLAVINLGATRTTKMLLNSAASESNGEISPDGRWLAYDSNESGRVEIYVRPFPNVETARQQVSTGGGSRPLWSRNGRELFYYVAPDTIMAVPVRLGADVVLGNPQVVVKGSYAVTLNNGRHYDVSPDGQRFLLLKDAPTPDGQKPATPQVIVVQHWVDELKRLVPSN